MTGFGRILGASFYSLTALAASIMLVPDILVQFFVLWVALEMLLRWQFNFRPNSLKTLLVAVVAVLFTRASRQALNIVAGTPEQFIVDWGLDAAPTECGGLMDDPGIVPPTHTASCDIWSDPEKIVDNRVERILEQTERNSAEIEKWLHVNWPDKRERTGSDAVVV